MPRKKTKRADGRYMIKRKMPDGRFKYFYGASPTEAEAKFNEAYKKAILDEQKNNGGATFREMAAAYKDYITGPSKPVKRGTINAYIKNIPPLLETFGDTPMADIDTQAVCAYMERMKIDGKALHTITNAKSVLSCIFTYWCANYHGTSNPTTLAKPPAGMKRGKRTEPTQAQRKLIDAHPEGCGFWAQLFEYTGLRLAEANALQWKDVDFDQNVIRVYTAMPWDRNHPYTETPKSEKGYRNVPILTPLRPLLLEQKNGHSETDYVMSGENKPLTESKYEWRWSIYCRDLGLAVKQAKHAKVKGQPGKIRIYYKWKALVTAHQFRHFYATNLFYAGVPDKVAQKLMGHADIMTTRRIYQELRDSEDQAYIKQLDDYTKSQKNEMSKGCHK